MSIKTTRRVGLVVVLVTILLGGIFLPAFYPAHDSSTASASRHRTMQHLAYAHLFTGALAGFGIALLVWRFRSAESTGKDAARSPLPAAASLRSPDGNIEVIKKKNFSESERIWCGWIDIPGHKFLLRGRRFMDPIVFSPNSRYLALTEYTGTDHQLSRVVVLDFLTDTLIIAHDEKVDGIERLSGITSLRWTNDSTLRIGTFAGVGEGERIRTWKA